MTERETTPDVKTYRVIVGPNGEVFQPASCWVVDVTTYTETFLRADIARESHLGDVMRAYGARDLNADLIERVEATEDTP